MERFGGTRKGDRIDGKSMGARGRFSAANRTPRNAITRIGFAETRNRVRISCDRDNAGMSSRAMSMSSGVASIFRDEIPLFRRDIPLFSDDVPQQGGVAPFSCCDVPEQRSIAPFFCCGIPQQDDIVSTMRRESALQRDAIPQQSGVVPLFRFDIPLFRGKTSLFPNLVALQRLDIAMYSHEPCAGSHAGSPKPGHRSTVFR
jgi:hypothetical protein